MGSKRIDDVIVALSIAVLLYGLFLLLTKDQILVSLLMIGFSSFFAYWFHTKNKSHDIGNVKTSDGIDLVNVFLGFSLIILDAIFNLVVGGNIGSFDLGLIFTGIAIIVLNTNIIKMKMFDHQFIIFVSRFLFVFMLIYGFLFSGIQHLTGNLSENYLLTFLTLTSGRSAGFFLGFLGDTTITTVFDSFAHGVLVDYQGFRVAIYSPCSGAESIVIFLSAVIGFISSNRHVNFKKIAIYCVIGLFALFAINVFRMILLVLIGFYFGSNALMFFHYNLGWVFFVSGMAIFWWLVMRDKELIN